MSQLSLIAALFTLISMTASAKGEAQKARFEPWLSLIEQSMTSSSNAEKVAEKLLDGQNRIAAFNLQALGKLYVSQDPDFSPMIRANFKSLEDGIGTYDKWNNIANASGKEKDKKKAEKAKANFAEMLTTQKWIGGGKKENRLKQIREFLNDQKWLSYNDDKNQNLDILIEQVESIAQTDYDLTRLELTDGDGNGLHELRREIRWFMIESRVLNGMLQFREDPKDCSIPEYSELYKTSLAESKYSTLPGSALETEPCRIEQCLFLGLSSAVNILGELKDAAEQDAEARETDTVPANLQAQGVTLQKELQSNQIFSKLAKNLRQCQK